MPSREVFFPAVSETFCDTIKSKQWAIKLETAKSVLVARTIAMSHTLSHHLVPHSMPKFLTHSQFSPNDKWIIYFPRFFHVESPNSNFIKEQERKRDKKSQNYRKKKKLHEKVLRTHFFVFFVSTLLLSILFFQLINKYIQIERIKKRSSCLEYESWTKTSRLFAISKRIAQK